MATKDGNKDLQPGDKPIDENITEEDIENIEYTHEYLEDEGKSSTRWSRTAVILSALAVIIAIIFAGCSIIATNVANKCSSALSSATAKPGLSGVNGLDGISAYQQWLKAGNNGTPEEFINSLIGSPGKDGVNGSNGIDGINGKDGLSAAGKSAYELWLLDGHSGTVQDFLASLIGREGVKGVDGLNGASAYQHWLDAGHTGTVQDFLNSLVGTNGTNGVNGLSAYQLWLDEGNTGDVQAFLKSLIGAAGTNGAAGANGINGINGASAYELWLAQGNTGDVDAFIIAITGAKGDKGDTGATGATGICTVGDTGPAGPQGEQGIQGVQGPVGAQGVEGPAGQAFTLKGSYADLAAFQAGAGAASGTPGEGWLLESDGSIMVWTTDQGWIDAGDIRGAQGPMGPQGIQGVQGLQGPIGLTGATGANANVYYGSWYSAITQTATAGTKTRMYYEVPIVNDKGVHTAIGSDGKYSDIVFEHDGVYNLQFSAQLHNNGGAGSGQNFIIWLGANGSDVPMSATDVTVNTNGPWMVASWNFFITAKAGDTAQLFWQNDKDSLVIQATGANGTPGIPSIILTVNQVG